DEVRPMDEVRQLAEELPPEHSREAEVGRPRRGDVDPRGDGHRAVQPPSMRTVWPVISDAAGDARKTTAPATSIGSPIRCRPAIRSFVSASNAGSASAPCVPGVRMNVGATALTVIPCWPHSTARHFVRWATAALDMQYTDSPGSA